MLYFSETDWTRPDIMEVNDEFDRDYDSNAYEKKITRVARISKSACARTSRGIRFLDGRSGHAEQG